MSNTERAAEVIANHMDATGDHRPLAGLLAAENLLVTDEMQYVLDMVALFRDGMTSKSSLTAAYSRYLFASRGEPA